MSMWDYLAAHPWWGLVYLIVACFTVIVACSSRKVMLRDVDTVTFKGNDHKIVQSNRHSDVH